MLIGLCGPESALDVAGRRRFCVPRNEGTSLSGNSAMSRISLRTTEVEKHLVGLQGRRRYHLVAGIMLPCHAVSRRLLMFIFKNCDDRLLQLAACMQAEMWGTDLAGHSRAEAKERSVDDT